MAAKAKIAVDDKFDFDAFAKDPNRENRFKSGEFVIPKQDTDLRKRFESALAGNLSTPAPGAAPAPAPAPQPEKAAPAAPAPQPAPAPEGVKEKPAPAPQPAQQPAEPYWKQAGYDTEAAMVKAHNDLKTSVTKQQELVRKLNNTATEKGRDASKLREQLDAVNARIAELEKKTPAPAGQAPIAPPKFPDPKDETAFPGGVMSEEFVQAVAEYNANNSAYLATVADRLSKAEARNAELETQLGTIKPRVDDAANFAQSNREQSVQTAKEALFTGLWGEVKQFQAEFHLLTSVPWEAINENLVLRDSPDGDPTAKEAAATFINALPKGDLENWERVKKAIVSRFEFTDKGPKAQYKSFRGALIDNGLFDEFNIPIPREPTPAEAKAAANNQQQPGTASALPADKIPAGDEPFSQQMSAEEEVRELLALNDERKMDPTVFKQNSAKWTRYSELRSRHGAPMQPQHA